MKGTVLYSPRDIRFEDRETPKIVGRGLPRDGRTPRH